MFHDAVVSFLPFLGAKIRREKSREHESSLLKDTFLSLMRHLYTGSVSHFTVLNSIELLEPKIGLSYYFCGEEEKTLVESLTLKSNDKVEDQNCVKVLLLSSIRNVPKVKEKSIQLLKQKPELLSSSSQFALEERVIILEETLRAVLEENKTLRSKLAEQNIFLQDDTNNLHFQVTRNNPQKIQIREIKKNHFRAKKISVNAHNSSFFTQPIPADKVYSCKVTNLSTHEWKTSGVFLNKVLLQMPLFTATRMVSQ